MGPGHRTLVGRATYCFRRGLEAKPDDGPTLRSLAECLGMRAMTDARREVELFLSRKSAAGQQLALGKHPVAPGGSTWLIADRLAVNHLHLGEPDSARRIWQEGPAPSPAVRLTRLAEADMADSMPSPPSPAARPP